MKKTIYLAGGCFWGVEKYISQIPGVTLTSVGYANGNTQNPSYEEVCSNNTGHVETVKVEYDPLRLSLTFLLDMFYEVIDPTTLNKQGNDIGTQYRTGIYYVDEADREIILGSIALLQESYDTPIVIETALLKSYYAAEEYHQSYLNKNPGGYCHISKTDIEKARHLTDKNTVYRAKEKDELRQALSDMQFEVTQNNATEPPFQNEYYNKFEPGIYVDITTGEPLFVSTDKFESGCGWPSFSKPISADLLVSLSDTSHGRNRVEIRSKQGDAHLGHVFDDGPKELGGLRYCINSASLRFIHKDKMAEEGYGHLLSICES